MKGRGGAERGRRWQEEAAQRRRREEAVGSGGDGGRRRRSGGSQNGRLSCGGRQPNGDSVFAPAVAQLQTAAPGTSRNCQPIAAVSLSLSLSLSRSLFLSLFLSRDSRNSRNVRTLQSALQEAAPQVGQGKPAGQRFCVTTRNSKSAHQLIQNAQAVMLIGVWGETGGLAPGTQVGPAAVRPLSVLLCGSTWWRNKVSTTSYWWRCARARSAQHDAVATAASALRQHVGARLSAGDGAEVFKRTHRGKGQP